MKLVAVKDNQRVKEFELQDGTNLVGRWDPSTGSFPEIDLEEVDTDARVSRRHALITFRPESLTLEDLGSLNGTILPGGVRATQEQRYTLKVGDTVVFGSVALIIEE